MLFLYFEPVESLSQRTELKYYYLRAFFVGEIQIVLINGIAFAGDKLLFGGSQASSSGEADIVMSENQFLVKNRQEACCGHTLSGTQPWGL